MYVTRPLSLYKNSPSSLSLAPPEGPNTGILVIQDQDSESRSCFGLCKDPSLKLLPFPQNKNLQLYYTLSNGTSTYSDVFYALMIPCLNQPLSSNQYYIIKSSGKHKGLAYTSSKEEDMKTCCFCRRVGDVHPQPFNPNNTYQQFEINNATSCCKPYGFEAKSLSNDGFPPRFLREYKGWDVYTKTLKNFEPIEALGLDAALRARLPDFSIPLPCKSSEPVTVAKWYCPFIFIREGSVDSQVKESTYYQLTLEQNWEEISGCANEGRGNTVDVDVSVEKQQVSGGGFVAERMNVDGKVMWFPPLEVGLSLAIVERVKWEQERGGFKWGGMEERERVRKTEEYRLGEIGEWRRFGCYVLVEKYVLKRMNGSVVLTWEFKHTHQIRSKWE